MGQAKQRLITVLGRDVKKWYKYERWVSSSSPFLHPLHSLFLPTLPSLPPQETSTLPLPSSFSPSHSVPLLSSIFPTLSSWFARTSLPSSLDCQPSPCSVLKSSPFLHQKLELSNLILPRRLMLSAVASIALAPNA